MAPNENRHTPHNYVGHSLVSCHRDNHKSRNQLCWYKYPCRDPDLGHYIRLCLYRLQHLCPVCSLFDRSIERFRFQLNNRNYNSLRTLHKDRWLHLFGKFFCRHSTKNQVYIDKSSFPLHWCRVAHIQFAQWHIRQCHHKDLPWRCTCSHLDNSKSKNQGSSYTVEGICS